MSLSLTAFSELALILLVCALTGALAGRLRQPLLIAYIVIGIAVGPTFLGLVQAHDQIDLLAQMGVTVLLFLVGLKLDLQHVRHIGKVALATGLGQLFFTIVLGFLLLLALQRDWLEALYVAVALTFSSTIIIVKLLTDKRELDTLHGRIAVGFLIVQDLAVVVAMMVMSGMAGAQSADAGLLAMMAARLVLVGLSVYVLMRFVLPVLMRVMARSQELLLIFAIAWGCSFAAFGEWLGLSKEAGAFLAGFSLASTGFRDAIHSRLSGIRDFLLLFFFIDLGAKLNVAALGADVWPALLLSAFVLVGNPIIVMAIMGYMGYRPRTGFLAGLTVAQISEFSIIFVAMGISLGHVQEQALALTTLVGLITITLSTYMILYSHALYERLAPWLVVFSRGQAFREQRQLAPNAEKAAQVWVVGLGRYGIQLAQSLRQAGIRVAGLDFDPEVVRLQRSHGLSTAYGDCSESAFMESLPLTTETWLVSTLPDMASNLGFLQALKAAGVEARIAVVLRHDMDAEQLTLAGAQVLLQPLHDAVNFAATRLEQLISNKGV